MRGHFRSLALVAAIALVSFGLVSGIARQAPGGSIKELMGDNFQNIQVMLYNLVTARYDKLPGQISTIHDHAVELPKNMPDTVKTDIQKRVFTVYAYQLESHTANMLVVLKELNKHDQTQSEPGKLDIDYLRVVAAQHFGEIVSTCVLCHNQFRRVAPQ